MIDFVKMEFELNEQDIPPNVWNSDLAPFEWNGLDFFPLGINSFRATKPSLKSTGLDNLNILFYGGQAAKLSISNSLHKLCHGGINHTDFTRSQVSDTLDFLSEKLKTDIWSARLKGRFEYGVNLEVENPDMIYLSQKKFKGEEATKMKSQKSVYGTIFNLGAYDFKTYDPIKKYQLMTGQKLKIPQPLIRIELANSISYLRKKGISLNYAFDLVNEGVLDKLGQDLVNLTKQIQNQLVLPSDACYKDVQKVCFFQNALPEHVKSFRKGNRSTFYDHQRQYKKLIKTYGQSNLEMSKMVGDKWYSLMYS